MSLDTSQNQLGRIRLLKPSLLDITIYFWMVKCGQCSSTLICMITIIKES